MKKLVFENQRGKKYIEYLVEKFGGGTIKDFEYFIDNDFAVGNGAVFEGEGYRLVMNNIKPKVDYTLEFESDDKFEFTVFCYTQNIIYQKDEGREINISTPNGFMFIKGKDKLKSFTKAHTPIKIISIYFNIKEFPEPVRKIIEQQESFVYHLGDYHFSLWRKHFDVIVKETIHEDLQHEFLRLKLTELFVLIKNIIYSFDKKEEDHNIFSKYELEIIHTIKDDIDSNLKEKPKLKELSKKHAINVSKMTLIFKTLFGDTIYSYFNQQRLYKAKEMLELTDKNITEVAYEFGFSTVNHFSKSFIKEFEVTPSEVKAMKK